MGIILYHQGRVDQGVRTGILFNGRRAWERFVEGDQELQYDPLADGIRWYLDLEFEGAGLPGDPEQCREWLIEHQQSIVTGLRELADQLNEDDDLEFPIRREFAESPPGVSINLTMSGMLKVPIQEFSHVLRDLAGHWKGYVNSMERFAFEVL